MSFTPESEKVESEVEELTKAIIALNTKLTNRILHNGGDWNKNHREECIELRAELEKLALRLEEL